MSNNVTMNQNNSVVLQRDTFSIQVLSNLMDWIMDGTLKMGEKLNTEDLARQLGVSRMPIREALSGLEKMGLAESIPYVGMKLVSLTQDDVLQVYLMRQLLEPLVAEKSCANITKEDLEDLKIIHQEYIQIVKEPKIDAKKLYLQNRKFHFAIYSISGMGRVCSVIESLWNTLSFFKLLYGFDVIKNNGGPDRSIEEHQSYIDILKNGDSKLLSQKLYDNLAKRIEEISKESNYYNS